MLPNACNVLVIDDDELLQKLLQEFLGLHGYSVKSLFDGETLEDFLELNKVDVIILDIMLPGQSGFHWLGWLRDNYPALPVLVLSAQDRTSDRIEGLERGADDYLVKPFHTQELLLRLQAILRHRQLNADQPPQQYAYAYCFDPERSYFMRDGKQIRLTLTETRILGFLFANVGKVVSRDDISEAVRGNSHHPLDRSIDVHINRLRKKIEVNPGRPRHLNTVWGIGYRFLAPEKKLN